MKNDKVKFIVKAAMLAAIYAVLTLAVSPIAFGPLQLRISESMIMFAALTPAAIPGLTVGCIIANLASPYGLWDIILGSLATLLSVLFAYGFRKIKFKKIPLLSPLGAVVFNAFLVSLSIYLSSGSSAAYFTCVAEIALSQLASCYLIGIPLWLLISKRKEIIL